MDEDTSSRIEKLEGDVRVLFRVVTETLRMINLTNKQMREALGLPETENSRKMEAASAQFFEIAEMHFKGEDLIDGPP